MKSFRTVLAVLFVALAMVGIISTASAAPLNGNFVTGDNRVVQIEHILSFQKNDFNKSVDIKQVNGSLQPFADPTGALFNRMRSAAQLSGYFVQVPGTDRWLHTRKHTEVTCQNGQSLIAYGFVGQPEYFADGCALHALIKANSNAY